jgi:hypothetical protein
MHGPEPLPRRRLSRGETGHDHHHHAQDDGASHLVVDYHDGATDHDDHDGATRAHLRPAYPESSRSVRVARDER